ncbi:MAG: porin family protein [Bacteroidota bacterium]
MKRTFKAITVVLLTTMVVASATAQIEFGAGLKLGLNFGTLSLDPETLNPGVTKSGKMGFMVGGVAELGFAKMFYVVLEPTYVGHGCEFSQGPAKQTLSYNYLNLPFLFKVKFLKGMVRPYGFAGPSFGILLSSKSKTEGAGPGFDGESDLKDFTEGTNFAIDFGGGAEINIIPKLGLTADVRYSLGLSDINKTPAAPGAQALKIKTRGFQVLLGAIVHLM